MHRTGVLASQIARDARWHNRAVSEMRYLMSDAPEFICRRKNRDETRGYRRAKNVTRLQCGIETIMALRVSRKYTCDLIRAKQSE